MLNEYQKRALCVQLRSIEASIHRMKGWAESASRRYHLTYYKTLDSTQRDTVLPLLQSMIRDFGELVERLRLEPQEVSSRDLIAAEAGGIWLGIHKITSRNLTRYGSLEGPVKEILDPILDRLLQAILDLEKVLEDF